MALAPRNRFDYNTLPEKVCLAEITQSESTNKVVFHRFTIGDVEEPGLYASISLSDWRKTEKGLWCWENSKGPIYFHSMLKPEFLNYEVAITGELSDQDLTFFRLKWPEKIS